MADLRLAFRTLSKTPFVTAVAVVSLALGIGANSAVYSLFHQILLRPLPVSEPDRLVNLGAPGPKPGSTSCNDAGDCEQVFSYPMFRDLEREAAREGAPFSGLAAHRSFGANLASRGRTSTGTGMLVSGGYFPTLGLAPALGRLLGPGDDAAVGEARVVVLGHDYWQRQFGGRPDALDEPLVVNGQALAVVGVAPAGFRGTTLGNRPDVFVPITLRGSMSPGFDGFDDRLSYWAYLFARLAPGVDRERAEVAVGLTYRALVEEVEAPLQEGMSAATMARFLAKEVTLTPGARGQSSLHREASAPLLLLLAIAGVVLLIACANIANLLLARSAARAGEISVRLAIGAGRSRLVAQLLTEAGVLAALGGAAGVLTAGWTLRGIGALLPPEAGETLVLALDPPAVAFAAALALGTGLLFGLYPALHATRPDLASALRGQAGRLAGGRAAARFRTSLVTAQIALSLALLVSAGLFARSLLNVARVDLGLAVDRLVTFSVAPELNGYPPERSRALFEKLEEELAAIPGVTGVTAAMVPLLGGSNWGTDVWVEGLTVEPDSDHNSRFNEIAPAYFTTLGTPLLAGREFTAADGAGAPGVAIVNVRFAEKFGLGRDAVGKRMSTEDGAALDLEIVGLAADAKYSQVKDEVPPLFFLPYRQDDELGFLTFYLRAALPPEEVLAAVPRVVARLDPDLPVDELRTMPEQVRENVVVDRFITLLTVAFGTLATLLAAVGLYGVLAYTVAQRTRELGLRMALGADRARVLGLVLGQVARMTAVGGAIGLACALGLGRLARSQLYEVAAYDPVVLAAAVLALAAVALASGLAPARAAARTDPMEALRYE
jgi:predicted permease